MDFVSTLLMYNPPTRYFLKICQSNVATKIRHYSEKFNSKESNKYFFYKFYKNIYYTIPLLIYRNFFKILVSLSLEIWEPCHTAETPLRNFVTFFA